MTKQKNLGTILIVVALAFLGIFVISALGGDTGTGDIFRKSWKTDCRVEVENAFFPVFDIPSTIKNVQCSKSEVAFCSDFSSFSIWGGEGGTLIMEVRDNYGTTARNERNWNCGQAETCSFNIAKCTKEEPMIVDMTLRHENGNILSQEQRRL